MGKNPRPRRSGGSLDRYLHAMVLLAGHGRPVDTGDLARKVGVSDAAASRMLRTLAEKGFVRVEPYQGAELTSEGLRRALRVVRRHRLLERYLYDVMGFDLREAHDRAMLMQPTIDQLFEDRLDELLGRPQLDPHGQPIPSRNATWPKLADAPLVDVPVGTRGRVSRVTSDDAVAIAYVTELGIGPGARILVEEISPFDGPVVVRVGGKVHHLGRRLAAAVHVAEREAGQERSTRVAGRARR